MPKFIPKQIPDTAWHQLEPNRVYGIRTNPGEDVHLRLGPGGLFVSVGGSVVGRFVNTVNNEDGTLSVIGKINEHEWSSIGRGAECPIKLLHAIVSRKHVELRLEGNVLLLKDCGSTNGSFIHADAIIFDIEEYIEKNKDQKPSESTMDYVREAFGPAIDDFLKKYPETKIQEGTTNADPN